MTPSQLIAIRQRGYRPTEPLYLSLIGPLKLQPFLLASDNLDARALFDLRVVIVHIAQVPRVVEMADRLTPFVSDLECWDVSTDRRVGVIENFHTRIEEVPSW